MNRVVHALATIAVLAGACRGESTPIAPLPVVTFLREHLATLPAGMAPGTATIGEVTKPALAVPATVRGSVSCPKAGPPDSACTVIVPAMATPVVRAVVELEEPKAAVRRTLVDVQPGTPSRTSIATVRHAIVRVRPVPALDTLTLTTTEIDVPAGARLRAAVGVDDAFAPSGPMDAHAVVSVLTRDGERTLATVPLAPGPDGGRHWSELDLPLAEFAGDRIRFRFSAATSDANATVVPSFGEPAIVAPAPARQRPNVVLISIDTLRARNVGTYGAGADRSPVLDGLGRAGVVFERASTTWPNTLAAHMTMLTGRYPWNHGPRMPLEHLPADVPLLAERMQAAGYHTAAFTENGYVLRSAGFARGFGHYDENLTVRAGAGAAAETFARAGAWATRTTGPAFLFVHTYQVHDPYDPPPDYRLLVFPENPPEGAPLLYAQEVRYLDDELGRFVARLDGLWNPRDTLLVVTADHGEEFGEHGAIRHVQLYDEVMQIPMIMRWPRGIPAGRRVETPVSLVDVVPTILALTGLEPIPRVDGLPLTPLLQDPPSSLGRDHVLAAVPPSIFTVGTNPLFVKPGPQFVVRSATHKLVLHVFSGELDCFDLTTDPDERHRLPYEAIPDDLRAALAVATKPADELDPEKVSPHTREKLRQLGYIE